MESDIHAISILLNRGDAVAEDSFATPFDLPDRCEESLHAGHGRPLGRYRH
jgi:hypothetical protein